MPSGIPLSAGVLVGTQKPTDARYGPYASISAALTDLTSVYRYKGLTVGIETGGVITEYWFNDGIQDTDFVVKTAPTVSSFNPFTTAFPTVLAHTIPSGIRNHFALYSNSTSTNVTVNLPASPLEGDTLTVLYTASVGFGTTLTVSGGNPDQQVLQLGDSVSFVAESYGGTVVWTLVSSSSVQADWSEGVSSSPRFIRNKPTNFTGSNGTVAGTSGFVPAPAETDNTKFLKGDGTWTLPSPADIGAASSSDLDQLFALNLALS